VKLFSLFTTGYVVDGDDERLCTTHGAWDGLGPDVPACVKQCPIITPLVTTKVSPVQCSTQ